jgi:hypothetical protein
MGAAIRAGPRRNAAALRTLFEFTPVRADEADPVCEIANDFVSPGHFSGVPWRG